MNNRFSTDDAMKHALLLSALLLVPLPAARVIAATE
jgi:hypothetical protein